MPILKTNSAISNLFFLRRASVEGIFSKQLGQYSISI